MQEKVCRSQDMDCQNDNAYVFAVECKLYIEQ